MNRVALQSYPRGPLSRALGFLLAHPAARMVRLTDALTLADACHHARELPPATHGPLCPVGWGLYPPEDIPPIVVVRHGTRSVRGTAIPDGHHGIVGAIWQEGGAPVLRCSWGGDLREPSLVADIRESAIALTVVLRGPDGRDLPERRTGWCLGRLEPAPDGAEA